MTDGQGRNHLAWIVAVTPVTGVLVRYEIELPADAAHEGLGFRSHALRSRTGAPVV